MILYFLEYQCQGHMINSNDFSVCYRIRPIVSDQTYYFPFKFFTSLLIPPRRQKESKDNKVLYRHVF